MWIRGNGHLDTITAMNYLASTLGEQGHLDKARALFEVAVQRMKFILRNNHPLTRVASANSGRLEAKLVSVEKLKRRNSSLKSRSLAARMKRMFRGNGDT
jgi:hypothetical protein